MKTEFWLIHCCKFFWIFTSTNCLLVKEERFISSLGSNKWVDHPLSRSHKGSLDAKKWRRSKGGEGKSYGVRREWGIEGKGGKVWKRDGLGWQMRWFYAPVKEDLEGWKGSGNGEEIAATGLFSITHIGWPCHAKVLLLLVSTVCGTLVSRQRYDVRPAIVHIFWLIIEWVMFQAQPLARIK